MPEMLSERARHLKKGPLERLIPGERIFYLDVYTQALLDKTPISLEVLQASLVHS